MIKRQLDGRGFGLSPGRYPARIAPFRHPRGAPFEAQLCPDRQIIYARNRLTFGPRPGDVEEVRRVGGIEAWTDSNELYKTLRIYSEGVLRRYVQPQTVMTITQPPNLNVSRVAGERPKVMNSRPRNAGELFGISRWPPNLALAEAGRVCPTFAARVRSPIRHALTARLLQFWRHLS